MLSMILFSVYNVGDCSEIFAVPEWEEEESLFLDLLFFLLDIVLFGDFLSKNNASWKSSLLKHRP